MLSKIYTLLKLHLLRISDRNYDIRFNQENLLKIIESEFDHKNSYIKKESKIADSPAPWFTYSAIEFLKSLDLSSLRVFEYGSGIGTLFWKKNAKGVTSVESDKVWFDKVQELSTFNKDELFFIKNKNGYVNSIDVDKKPYDLVVVDGIYRYDCVKAAVKNISQNGIIILDNAEWYPKTTSYLRNKGFKQLDFCGFGPVVYFTWKTSFFIKSLTNIKYKKKNMIPIGSFKHNVEPE